jgi:trans-aconitate methyltransferase
VRDHREWDARAYHRLSDPQVEWGERVLDRLQLAGDELVLDAGCGTGRLTLSLARRLPSGSVVGVDLSGEMLRAARQTLESVAAPLSLVRADLLRLPFRQAFDVVFSTATLHWVLDHEALFAELFSVLVPGGRLHAQCGGGPNLARILDDAAAVMRTPPFQQYFSAWATPWNFADPHTAAERLRAAGFENVDVTLEAAPARFADEASYREFLARVVFRAHLQQLPDSAMRDAFLDAVLCGAASADSPLTLDYWRLNLSARRPVGRT